MKISLSVLSVFLLGFSGLVYSNPSLLGTWQSNAELTIKSIESIRELSPENREAYSRLFGQMKLAFSEDSVVIVDLRAAGSDEFSTSYRVIDSGPDHISIEFGDPDDPSDSAEYFYDESCMKRKLEAGKSLQGAFEYWCKVE